jgi:hypothetical protein
MTGTMARGKNKASVPGSNYGNKLLVFLVKHIPQNRSTLDE